MKSVIVEFLSFLYILTKVNIYKSFHLYNKKSNNIILMDFNFSRILKRDIGLIYDISFILYFIEKNKDFRIVEINNIGKIHNKNIILNLSKYYNRSNLDNWSGYISDIIKHLEAQGNFVSPTFDESLFWENKIYMYKQFEIKGLNFPKTTTLNNIDLIKNTFNFPVITKIPHGAGSVGIEELKSDIALDNFYSKVDKPKNYLIQERINMKMDARIVILGFKYFDHYFRENLTETWHPTSTSKGSILKYYDLPMNVINYLEKISSDLNLRSAAFDVCWENNDLKNPPIVLEVSPAYLPNPKFNGSILYKNWKKIIFIKNPYWKANVDNLIKHRKRLAEVFLNEK
jgi:glutathione synthase/RimK-type ligase-like ATP-grasp enzyme